MNYDEAEKQAICVLDDEFNNNFQVFGNELAGHDLMLYALQNWFNASGKNKVHFADDLEFAISAIRTHWTDQKKANLADEILTESGGKVDTETGEWI